MAQPEAVARRYKELGLRMPVEQAEQRLKQDLLSIRQELQEQGVDTTEGYADLDILTSAIANLRLIKDHIHPVMARYCRDTGLEQRAIVLHPARWPTLETFSYMPFGVNNPPDLRECCSGKLVDEHGLQEMWNQGDRGRIKDFASMPVDDILREFGAPIERPKRSSKVKEIFRRYK